ncbi:hypothetical protein KsCSTR_37330 [Candidatus Kuenenia stuttgartiensis]|uniref:Uncharacterized protein n=1 Tax=Kuenenia stuttgartiensis TaxID=174633 RepID=Q1Q692_KUEST|nr:hypothetical protein KsCSTR_37330 [Candidatus Kuenenia stuttgartiensis]CAJ73089.1 unknown protein [Candidatus Kuenenia stuttgartiensis]
MTSFRLTIESVYNGTSRRFSPFLKNRSIESSYAPRSLVFGYNMIFSGEIRGIKRYTFCSFLYCLKPFKIVFFVLFLMSCSKIYTKIFDIFFYHIIFQFQIPWVFC